MLSTSTVSVISSAPPHASVFQSSNGLIANWKITTGRFAIGAFMSVLQNWLLSAVNSSGAVSPEMRATASSTPVIDAAAHRPQRDHQDHLPHRRAERHRRLAQAVRHQAAACSRWCARPPASAISASATEPGPAGEMLRRCAT